MKNSHRTRLKNIEDWIQLKNIIDDISRQNEKEELGLRKGQIAMNALFSVDRQLYTHITGTPVDPFYTTERLTQFFESIKPFSKSEKLSIKAIHFRGENIVDYSKNPKCAHGGLVLMGIEWVEIINLFDHLYPQKTYEAIKGWVTTNNYWVSEKDAKHMEKHESIL